MPKILIGGGKRTLDLDAKERRTIRDASEIVAAIVDATDVSSDLLAAATELAELVKQYPASDPKPRAKATG